MPLSERRLIARAHCVTASWIPLFSAAIQYMGTHKSKIALGLILLAGLVLRLVFIEASAPMDDAYITFRYAQNLASGHGFVYNVGDPVLGVTTPLFALILAPFAIMGIPLDAAALGLAVVLDLLICVLLYRLLREYFGEPIALVAALFYSFAYTSLAASGYGMETQLFNFLLVASILLLSLRKYSAMGIVVGLAVLTRPEGILLAGILGARVLARQLRGETNAARNSLAAFLGVTVPWFVFAFVFFGSPIPNSLLTKMLQESVTVRQWLDFFIIRNPFVTALWAGAAVGSVVGLRRKCEPCAVLGLWAVAYLLFFLAGRPPFLGVWYFPPEALALTVLSAVGAVSVLAWILRSPVRGALAAAFLFILVDVVVLPRSLASARWQRHVVDSVYRPMGDWFRTHSRPGDLVHCSDIGYLGYISQRTILDASGLVTPDIRTFRAGRRWDPNWDILYVLRKKPDYVVLPVGGHVNRRFCVSEFPRDYEPIARFQVEGRTELRPSRDPSDEYARDSRFMADFIVYEKRGGP